MIAKDAPAVTGAARLDQAGPPFIISAVGVVLVALTMRQSVAGVPPILADLQLDPRLASLLVSIPVFCFALGALAGPALVHTLTQFPTVQRVLVKVGGRAVAGPLTRDRAIPLAPIA